MRTVSSPTSVDSYSASSSRDRLATFDLTMMQKVANRSLLARGYSGMFPCLRFGCSTRLVWSIRRARIRRGRVSGGSMTSSM
jgi:hypothetical protein